MRAPAFWNGPADSPPARLLAPAAALYAAATARRVAGPGWRAPVPVLCCGNAGVGGSGKTTLALDLGARLQARKIAVAFLTRGYGGSARTVLRVDPDRHDAAIVGDEALLLAARAPTYISADRAASARAAIADGAGVLVMDDGLQNPTLAQTASLLVIDGEAGFGNGRVIPAGPLREPAAIAAARCRAAVLVGGDRRGALCQLSPNLPVLRAQLVSQFDPETFGDRRLFAFAGIGRPEKFFGSLLAAGADVAATRSFADHHRYGAAEIHDLLADAARMRAVPVTTPKDAVRLPPASAARVEVIGVDMRWDDAAAIEALLGELMR